MLLASVAHAGQVIRDGTVGSAGALPGPDFVIPDTDGQTRGNNLFQSFSQFDLSQGESATFTGPDNIHNVIARVTGGNASTIDGTLNCAIDGANFFFINPFGVIFGEHAQVNVSGSFAVTTADYVKLADGGRFDARNPANDILTAAPVSAFGFLGPAAPITVNGITEDQNDPSILTIVPDGKSIWLVGGDIEYNGFWIAAFGGEIAMASVASAGELNVDVDDPRTTLDTTPFARLGTITLAHNVGLFVDGSPAGLVVMEADRINFLDHAGISAFTDGDSAAGGIILRARSAIELADSSLIALVGGDGAGADIVFTAPTIRLVDASVASTTVANGQAGSIFITATDFNLLNSGGVAVNSAGPGGTGNLTLMADHVLIQGDASLGSRPQLQAFVSGGPSGEINVQANTVELLAGGGIVSDSTAGDFAGSDIHITANTLVMDDAHGRGFTSISSRSVDAGIGGGNIVLGVAHLEVLNGAQITATAENAGLAGSVTVNGIDALVAGSSIASAATADGTAGSVTLNLTGSLRLQDGGLLSVSAAQNAGGDITVNAGNSIRLINSQITAQAFGDGGNVHLTAPSLIYLLNSQIRAESINGNGGNVTIDPVLVVLNNSLIKASAIVGNGGNISIVSDFFLASHSVIDASSEFGLQGTVNIASPDADLAGNFVGLDADPLDAKSRLRPHCSVRLPTGVSSFTLVGRGGTPIEPDGLLPALPATLNK